MLFTQEHAVINSRNIWHYLLDSQIGQVHVVQYEEPTKELTTFTFYNDNEKAERKFSFICKAILKGKM